MLTLAALVLSSLHPAAPVTSTALAQQKIQIIKGKPGTGTVKNNTNSEVSPQPVAPAPNTQRQQELDRQAAELDAKGQALDQREQALEQKQAEAAEAEKKKQEQLKAQQKTIEKLGAGNQKLWQQSADALAGD
jgi:hypothetical protein